MTAIVIVHPSFIARMSLRALVDWGHRYGLVASNLRAPSGRNYLVLNRAKEAA